MRIYIAGPMTGLPKYNFPAFIAMAERLRRAGHEVISPAELDDPKDRAAALASPDGAPQTVEGFGKSWGDFLARDVKLLSDGGIEAVVVLPGWESSRGARLETFVAMLNGLRIYRVETGYNGWATHLVEQPDIIMYRAWCAEPLLSVHHSFGKQKVSA